MSVFMVLMEQGLGRCPWFLILLEAERLGLYRIGPAPSLAATPVRSCPLLYTALRREDPTLHPGSTVELVLFAGA